jgi:hypothetical protein
LKGWLCPFQELVPHSIDVFLGCDVASAMMF